MIDTHGRNPGGETAGVNFDLTESISDALPLTMSRDALGRFYSPNAGHDSIPADWPEMGHTSNLSPTFVSADASDPAQTRVARKDRGVSLAH